MRKPLASLASLASPCGAQIARGDVNPVPSDGEESRRGIDYPPWHLAPHADPEAYQPFGEGGSPSQGAVFIPFLPNPPSLLAWCSNVEWCAGGGVLALYWEVAQGLAAGLVVPPGAGVEEDKHAAGRLMVAEAGGSILSGGAEGGIAAVGRDAPKHVRQALSRCAGLEYP